jgi:hypothetical protein
LTEISKINFPSVLKFSSEEKIMSIIKTPGFRNPEFGDERLNARFMKIYEEFQKNPSAILSHVFHNSHQCKAVYRFFDNTQVSKNKIIKTHHNELFEHIKAIEANEILEIQDTTECDFTDHPKTRGMGKLGSEKNPRKGMECHTSLIVSTEGLVLGIGSINLWSRAELKRNGKNNIRKIPIQKKESFKWINSIDEFRTDNFKNLSRIIIGDREADFYEFLDFIQATNKKMVVRLRWDRKTEDGVMLKTILEKAEEIGRTTIKIRSKGGKALRKEKKVELAISYSNVTICAPKNIDKSTVQDKLKITIVHAKEVNPANPEDALEWYLITNVEVNTFEDCLKIVRWYSYRWLIEEFHKILKAGIKIENARLNEKPKLEKLISFLAVIAIKILWMTRINRIASEAPMESILSEEETKFLRHYAKKKDKRDLDTVNDAIRYIANLGGFKGQRSTGDPGLLTLWRGLIKFYNLLEGYLTKE